MHIRDPRQCLHLASSLPKVRWVTSATTAQAPSLGTARLGGGSSAVAASAHAACARFRGTDPLITGRNRRKLAEELGRPDISAGIPEARWMRAMTFQRLVRDEAFASRIVTTTVPWAGIVRVECAADLAAARVALTSPTSPRWCCPSMPRRSTSTPGRRRT